MSSNNINRMFNNLNFATATHIVALLALNKHDWTPSSYISGSVNVNAVIIRKEIKKLKESGLIISKEGKNGGVRLADNIHSKTLADVYVASQQDTDTGKYNNPNLSCVVGKSINSYLKNIYDITASQTIAHLRHYRISDIQLFFTPK